MLYLRRKGCLILEILAVIGVGWLVYTFCGGSLLGIKYIAMPPRTYREAVMQVLDTHQIAYNEVDLKVEDWCPPLTQCTWASMGYVPITYQVTIDRLHPIQGLIVCFPTTAQPSAKNCTLTVTALDLHDIPLPPLKEDSYWSALLRHYWQKIFG